MAGFSDEICHLFGLNRCSDRRARHFAVAGFVGDWLPFSSNHGESSWLGVAFGIAFLFAGISVIIQAVLARGYPTTAEIASFNAVLAPIAPFSTWSRRHSIARRHIHLGGGWDRARDHSRAVAQYLAKVGGRIAFGIGAILIWIFLAAVCFQKHAVLFATARINKFNSAFSPPGRALAP